MLEGHLLLRSTAELLQPRHCANLEARKPRRLCKEISWGPKPLKWHWWSGFHSRDRLVFWMRGLPSKPFEFKGSWVTQRCLFLQSAYRTCLCGDALNPQKWIYRTCANVADQPKINKESNCSHSPSILTTIHEFDPAIVFLRKPECSKWDQA